MEHSFTKEVIIFFKMTGHVSLKSVCLIQLFVTHLNLYAGVFECGLTFWPIILQMHFLKTHPVPNFISPIPFKYLINEVNFTSLFMLCFSFKAFILIL